MRHWRFATIPVTALLLLHTSTARAQWERDMIGPTTLAFSPDGKTLAVGSIEEFLSPGELHLWDVKSGQLKRHVHFKYGVDTVAWSPDGKRLAIVGADESAGADIQMRDVGAWKIGPKLGGEHLSHSVAWSPDGKRLAAGGSVFETGESDHVLLWNLPVPNQSAAIRKAAPPKKLADSYGMSVVKFAPRGDILLGAFINVDNRNTSQSLRAWNATTGNFLWKRPRPTVTDIAFLAAGETFLASVSFRPPDSKVVNGNWITHGALQVWRTRDGKLLQTFRQSIGVSKIAVSPDGKTWAIGDDRGNVQIWNSQTKGVRQTVKLHQNEITALQFSPDNRFLASAGADDRVRLSKLPLNSPAAQAGSR